MSSPANWELINEATKALTARGLAPFSRVQVYEEIWKRHPDRQRGSLDPTFQGMVQNASGGPASAGGTPLRRVERGLYVREEMPLRLQDAETPSGERAIEVRDEAASPLTPPLDLVIASSVSLSAVLTPLATDRPVFHSEADFQQAFAWTLHLLDPSLHVRLETRPAPGMRLDLLVSSADRTRHTAIEFKYLTKRWVGEVDGERYELKDQGAQDISGYDVVKDLWRVEKFTSEQDGWNGAVVCLSNDPYYWRQRVGDRVTNAEAFRLHDGVQLSGTRAWGPLTGAGTRAGRDADLPLRGAYTMQWKRYSSLTGTNGEFRVLAVPVQR